MYQAVPESCAPVPMDYLFECRVPSPSQWTDPSYSPSQSLHSPSNYAPSFSPNPYCYTSNNNFSIDYIDKIKSEPLSPEEINIIPTSVLQINNSHIRDDQQTPFLTQPQQTSFADRQIITSQKSPSDYFGAGESTIDISNLISEQNTLRKQIKYEENRKNNVGSLKRQNVFGTENNKNRQKHLENYFIDPQIMIKKEVEDFCTNKYNKSTENIFERPTQNLQKITGKYEKYLKSTNKFIDLKKMSGGVVLPSSSEIMDKSITFTDTLYMEVFNHCIQEIEIVSKKLNIPLEPMAWSETDVKNYLEFEAGELGIPAPAIKWNLKGDELMALSEEHFKQMPPYNNMTWGGGELLYAKLDVWKAMSKQRVGNRQGTSSFSNQSGPSATPTISINQPLTVNIQQPQCPTYYQDDAFLCNPIPPISPYHCLIESVNSSPRQTCPDSVTNSMSSQMSSFGGSPASREPSPFLQYNDSIFSPLVSPTRNMSSTSSTILPSPQTRNMSSLTSFDNSSSNLQTQFKVEDIDDDLNALLNRKTPLTQFPTPVFKKYSTQMKTQNFSMNQFKTTSILSQNSSDSDFGVSTTLGSSLSDYSSIGSLSDYSSIGSLSDYSSIGSLSDYSSIGSLSDYSSIGSLSNDNVDLEAILKIRESIKMEVESSSSFNEFDDRESNPEVPEIKGTATVTRTSTHIHLWQFIKELLEKKEHYGSAIRWIDELQGIFKIEDSVKVAKLWGKRKNRPAMNYDKLSRSIRQYYKKGIMKKTERSQRLVYQFCHPYGL